MLETTISKNIVSYTVVSNRTGVMTVGRHILKSHVLDVIVSFIVKSNRKV